MFENDGGIKDYIGSLKMESAMEPAPNDRHDEMTSVRASTVAGVAARVPRLVGRALIKLYRLALSPLIGFHCRYLPTCSDYADQAVARHGLWAGGWMTLARLCRCHPWGNSGLDFVCETVPARARWYLPWRYGRWRGTNSAQQ